MILLRRHALLAAPALLLARTAEAVEWRGEPAQGALLVGRVAPGTRLALGYAEPSASSMRGPAAPASGAASMQRISSSMLPGPNSTSGLTMRK